MYLRFFKSIFDFLIALILFILISPIFILTIVILLISNRGKPFFFQKRPGKNGRIFKMIKFKTMTDDIDTDEILLPDSKRLTKIGRFIRKTSIDEIPQLINVIKGNMSLVGPRPLSVKYLKFYNQIQNQRHLVKPGITGWAQINGRNMISWERKFEYDVYYVNNVSFFFDLKIIILSFWKVLNREDVVEGGTESIESFNGHN
jgi:lipopolysaccharide/colanic/teichoic acid biosynthesis glycosyltransferase